LHPAKVEHPDMGVHLLGCLSKKRLPNKIPTSHKTRHAGRMILAGWGIDFDDIYLEIQHGQDKKGIL